MASPCAKRQFSPYEQVPFFIHWWHWSLDLPLPFPFPPEPGRDLAPALRLRPLPRELLRLRELLPLLLCRCLLPLLERLRLYARFTLRVRPLPVLRARDDLLELDRPPLSCLYLHLFPFVQAPFKKNLHIAILPRAWLFFLRFPPPTDLVRPRPVAGGRVRLPCDLAVLAAATCPPASDLEISSRTCSQRTRRK